MGSNKALFQLVDIIKNNIDNTMKGIQNFNKFISEDKQVFNAPFNNMLNESYTKITHNSPTGQTFIDGSILNIPNGLSVYEMHDTYNHKIDYRIDGNNFRRKFTIPVGGVSRADAERTLQNLMNEYKQDNFDYISNISGIGGVINDYFIPSNKDAIITVKNIPDKLSDIQPITPETYKHDDKSKYIKHVISVSDSINKVDIVEKRKWFKK